MAALDGLKIADFSWVGAGPRATKDLADNGATVIKIESRKRLDLGRQSPPFAGDPKNPDASAFFAQTNTSKKSVTINLADPRGVEVAKKLVAWADVVVENFGPGYMERIGLGYDTLRAIKSDVIVASVSVAGRTGPLAGFRGYGNSAAALSGHASLTGWPGGDPHLPPLAYGDVVAPMFATVAILAALEHRSRTGEGQHLDISQVEPMVHVIADLYAAGPELDKGDNEDEFYAIHGVFPAAGEDQWVAIAAHDADLPALAQALGLEDQPTPEAVAANTAPEDKFALADRLRAAGIDAAPVMDGKDMAENTALIGANHFVAIEHPVLGNARMPAPPYRLEHSPWAMTASPLLGEHNREVLIDLLGLDPHVVDALQAEGALA